ncbi:methyltransferase domain-containing protein [uncultured Nitrospira sp.]|uniref:class I SAM-dependent methyltransferase n=1 Tax=uncultured Nitrospira sp. TaxID=157176 RepID=UPI00313FF378
MANLQSHAEFVQELLADQDRRLNSVDYAGRSLPRFQYIVALCRRMNPNGDAKVLDIGRSYMSFMLAEYYSDVATLGFPLGEHGYAHEHAGAQGERQPGRHIVFDLNDAQTRGIASSEQFNLIVFAEVLEHLFTAPELVLHALRELLVEDGLIVCLTPNATALPKRIRLLRGTNPFERIRINCNNPGHYREYTKTELEQMGLTAGLEMVHHEFGNYRPARSFVLPRSKSQMFDVFCRMIPAFCLGQTAVYRKLPARS